MATSGLTNFSVTRDEIIQFALRKLRVLKRGQTLNATDTSEAAFALNMIVQQIRERSDGASSLKMWQRRRLRLFMTSGQYEYNIPGTHCCDEDELVTTTLTAAVASSATLTVASITGIANGDVAGVVEDDGSITWTTVSGAPSGSTVTLASNVTAAASGNQCFFYTNAAVMPVNIMSANLYYNVSEYESPLSPSMVGDYWNLSNKTAVGVPSTVFVERQRATTDIWLDQVPTDVGAYSIKLLVQYPIEYFNATSDNPDFPQQWYRTLGYLLVQDLAPEYGVELTPTLMVLIAQATEIAASSDPETTDLNYEPGKP